MNDRIRCAIQTSREELNAQGVFGEEIVIESVSALEKPLSPALGEARFVEPVTAVIAAISLASFAKYIVAHFLKRQEQGVQIDLRTVPPTLTAVPHVSTGTIITIDEEGKVAVHKVAYEEPEKLLPVLSLLFGKG